MNKIVPNFKPLSGKHCITCSLKQVFQHDGFPLSEEMLFGLGTGLSWFYMEHKLIPLPMLSGRLRPVEFEEILAENTGVDINVNKTTSKKNAYAGLKSLIEQDKPVMIYADMGLLKYLNLPDNYHFGGHSVVVFGIDEEKGIALVSDRHGKDTPLTVHNKILDNDYEEVFLEDLAEARVSKHPNSIFPPQNKWLEFDFSSFKTVTPEMIRKAIVKNADDMLNPKISNIGVKGIAKFADRILHWREFDDEKLKASAVNGYFMINEKGGTGGGAFRNMYGLFLKESSAITGIGDLDKLSDEYITISNRWDEAADIMLEIFEDGDRAKLKKISELLRENHEEEKRVMEKLLIIFE